MNLVTIEPKKRIWKHVCLSTEHIRSKHTCAINHGTWQGCAHIRMHHMCCASLKFQDGVWSLPGQWWHCCFFNRQVKESLQQVINLECLGLEQTLTHSRQCQGKDNAKNGPYSQWLLRGTVGEILWQSGAIWSIYTSPLWQLCTGSLRFRPGNRKNHVFLRFPTLFSGKCTPDMSLWMSAVG